MARSISYGLLLLTLLFGSCESRWPEANCRTPDGYRAYIPSPCSVDAALVMVWIDVRVADWKELRRDEYGSDFLDCLAGGTTFRVVDDYHFYWPSSFYGTEYAAGEIDPDSKHPTLRCCLYTGSYGTLAADGMGLPVIAFELDHRLGLNKEH